MASPADRLPALPLEEWEPTKDTLHLYLQVIGKIRLASTPAANHWWHVPLYVDERGLTTGRMRHDGVDFGVQVDLVDHAVVVRTAGGAASLTLWDGLSVAAFHDELLRALARFGVRPAIHAEPFGVPMTTPFPEDTGHASYDREYVGRFWRILLEVDWVLREFAGWFTGKTSPVHLFWHSLDLAVSRFSGRRAPGLGEVDPVTREAYSHEVISFGFWAGDRQVRAPAFYSYTAPEPAGLTAARLRPDGAFWAERGGSALATYWYEEMRAAPRPRQALLDFLQSAYEAGARAAGWDEPALRSYWCPPDVGAP